MFLKINKMIKAIKHRDPASPGTIGIVILYPSIHVMLFYFIARFFWLQNIKTISRIIMQLARFFTGIEIHPGAKIGSGFFIDHGMGVVIGETAEIGDNVTVYHGVTLGGIMPAHKADEQRGLKRHPTLKNNVIVGSGAQILGPIIIGSNARVGANSVVLKSVSSDTAVVGIPAHEVKKQNFNSDFDAYGTSILAVSKVDVSLKKMSQEIEKLNKKLDSLIDTKKK